MGKQSSGLKNTNKKVRGATPNTYDGIKFRSALERGTYQLLKAAGFDVKYEPITYHLWEGIKLRSVRQVAPNRDKSGKYSKDLFEQTAKLQDIKLTPDFEIEVGYYKIILEAKGNPNDVYPLKKKMLLKWLEDWSPDDYQYIYIEAHSLYQVKQAIEIIKKL